MSCASVADQDRPLRHTVACSSKRRALVDSVLVVEAAARCVQLDKLVTHSFVCSDPEVEVVQPFMNRKVPGRLDRMGGFVGLLD